jgi:hypothetical protein
MFSVRNAAARGRATWKWMSSRLSHPTFFPIVLKAAIEMRSAQCQNRVGFPHGPKHARLFQRRADHCITAGFDHARAGKQVLATKPGITHPLRIFVEVVCLGANLLGQWGLAEAMDRSPLTSFSIFPFSSRSFW